MFYFKTAQRNIWRCKSKSILTIFISIFIITLLNLYWGNIESVWKQLTDLADTIPIYCRISNLNGTKEAGLDIPEDKVLNLQGSSYVKNPVFTVRLVAGEGEFHLKDWKEKLNIPMIGTNSIQGVEGMTSEQITMKKGTSFDFLNSFARSCIVSKSCMDKNHWKIGDSVSLKLFYYYHKNVYELKIEPLDLVDFEIVGSMEGAAIDNSGYLPPEILLPFEAVREIYHAREIPFSADSAFFYVSDPLKINEFKAEMKKFHFIPQSPASKDNYKGEALFVKDSVFISAANRLRQRLDTFIRFLPIVLVAVICIGYITSYLMVYSRQKDFYIMRSIGFSYNEVFVIFLLEQMLLALGGSLIQAIISTILITLDISILFIVNLGFILIFMIGAVIAIRMYGKRNVMEALSQND